MASPIGLDADIDDPLADSSMDWDAYAARIAHSSRQHIVRLISTIKAQQKEIESLRARLQATVVPTFAPLTDNTTDSSIAAPLQPPATPPVADTAEVVVPTQSLSSTLSSPAPDALTRTAIDSETGSSDKRSRAEMEATDNNEESTSCKRSKQTTTAVEVEEEHEGVDDKDEAEGEGEDSPSAAQAAADDSDSSEPLTQSLPTLTVNILPTLTHQTSHHSANKPACT